MKTFMVLEVLLMLSNSSLSSTTELIDVFATMEGGGCEELYVATRVHSFCA